MKLLFLLTIMSLLSSCFSMGKRSLNVQVGDSKGAVISQMGEPEDTQSNGSNEAWQYCKTNFGHYIYSIIWFKDGLVTGKTSYDKPGKPLSFCDANFEPIKWESQPNTVIEIRNR